MEEAATKVVATPTKTTTPRKQKLQYSENQNPNLPSKSSKSPKPKAAALAVVVRSPQNRIRQRKFLVAKRNNNNNKTVSSCKCREEKCDDGAKCLCVAYENLRASQEEFLKNRQEELKKGCEDEEEELIVASLKMQDLRIHDNDDDDDDDDAEKNELELEGSSNVKRRRDKLLEEARNSVPETGSGKVMHLVKAFEKILSMPKSSRKKDQNENENEEEENEKREQNDENGHGEVNSNGNANSSKVKRKVMKWALPGLQFEETSFKAPELEVTGSCSGYGSGSSLICASDLVLTSENLGLDSRTSVASSWDSSRGSVSSRTSTTGGRRSRRHSLDSSGTYGGRRWKKKQQLKVTNQKTIQAKLSRTQSGSTRSRSSDHDRNTWQEVERTSSLSAGDGQDILSVSKHTNYDDSSDDADTESLGRIYSGAAASSSIFSISKAEPCGLVVNPMKGSSAIGSFFKLRCEVLGANIMKSGSKSFAVYCILVTDVNNNSWSIKRSWGYDEFLSNHIRLVLLLQCLVKPPVKESTKPIDLKLHSDMRVADVLNLINRIHKRNNERRKQDWRWDWRWERGRRD